MDKIIRTITQDEYEVLRTNKNVVLDKELILLKFVVDEFMGFTKCKIIIFKDLSVDYEEAYILGRDAPYKKATDSRMLSIMSNRLARTIGRCNHDE